MMEALESIGVTGGMITSLGITILLCGISIYAGKRMQTIPGLLQNFMEWAIDGLNNFFSGIMGEKACKKYFPIVATLFIYILFCNYSGLLPGSGHIPGLEAPTGSINCTLAMAVFVFVMMIYIGIKENKGIGYFKHYFKPFAFLFPLMVLEDLIKPVSLTLRLYGNIFGEHMVTQSFFDLIPIGVPVIMQALSVLMGLIQALVFSLLAAIYIKEVLPEEEEHL